MRVSCFFVKYLSKRFSNGEKLGIISVAGKPNLSGDVRGRRGTLAPD